MKPIIVSKLYGGNAGM